MEDVDNNNILITTNKTEIRKTNNMSTGSTTSLKGTQTIVNLLK
jgi:hypothetical protein